MSDHSDALTPEQKDFVERARQFQIWADQNGFGRNTNVYSWCPRHSTNDPAQLCIGEGCKEWDYNN